MTVLSLLEKLGGSLDEALKGLTKPAAAAPKALGESTSVSKELFGVAKAAEKIDPTEQALNKIKEALSFKLPPKPKASQFEDFTMPGEPAKSQVSSIEKTASEGIGDIYKVSDQFMEKWGNTISDALSRPVTALPAEQRERARLAGGYTTPAYRGTRHRVFDTAGHPAKEQMGEHKTYASDDPAIANMYANRLEHIADRNIIEGAVIQPLWIDTRDFLVHDHGGGTLKHGIYDSVKRKAEKQGKKGFILKNIIDEPGLTETSAPRTVYVAFPEYNTVKSKFAGRFDPKDPRWKAGIVGTGVLGASGGAFMSDEAQASPADALKVLKGFHASPADIPMGRSLRPELSGVGESALGRTGMHPLGRSPEESGLQQGYGAYVATEPKVAEHYRSLLTQAGGKPAHVYEGQLNIDPDKMLNFDKPFDQQSEAVKQAILKVYGSPQDMLKPDRAKAEALAAEGVQGVQYLDKRSRAKGEGTSNYALFSGKLFDITGKYGLGALIGGGAGTALTGGKAQAAEGRALGPSDDIGYGPGNYPPTRQEFIKQFGREPSTDTEVELYGETGQKRGVPWHRTPQGKEGVPQAKLPNDPFSPGIGAQIKEEALSGVDSVVEGIESLRGAALQKDPPDFLKKVLKDEGQEWSPGEKRSWQMLTGALETAGGATRTLLAPWVGGLKHFIDKSESTPEAKEGLKKTLDLAAGFAMPAAGVAGGAAKVGKLSSLWHGSPQLAGAAAPGPVQAVRQFLSPTTVAPKAEEAAGIIRQQTGMAARRTEATTRKLREDTAIAGASMLDRAAQTVENFFNNYEKQLNQMPQFEQWRLLDYMEGRSRGKAIPDPAMQKFADQFRDAMESRKTLIQSTPALRNSKLIADDYVTHYWKDPVKAAAFVSRWQSKQGTGAQLKKRTIPTIADGMRAGLDPVTVNPFEIGVRYITNMDRFIASHGVIEAGKRAGDLKWLTRGSKLARQYEGAGWIPLKGSMAEKHSPPGPGQRVFHFHAYAPREWATVYNNFVSQGFYANHEAGKIYETVRSAENAVTSVELGLSGFHMITMANEAWIADIAKSVGQITGAGKKAATGDFMAAMKLLSNGTYGITKAPLAPLRLARLGHKVEQVYLGRTPGTPDMRKIVNLYTQAGGRGVGRGHAPDYRYTAAGSYFDAIKAGTKMFELQPGLKGAAMFVPQQIGKIMQTVSQPLFEKYIPKVKNGAFYDLMKAWMEANPNASHVEQLKMARKIVDSVDNRFGEMIQDNIFWHNILKQSAMLSMRSYSWNLGTIREIGGGGISALRDPRRFDIASTRYDPRTSYVVALPVVAFIIGNVYAYMKTGKAPKDINEMISNMEAPKTGGTAPGVGGRGQVAERTMIPGYMKDVLGWYEDPYREFTNKISTLPRVTKEVASGHDWRGDPILQSDPRAPPYLKQYWEYALNNFGPFSVRQALKGNPPGSQLTTFESMMGMRPAGAQFQDPKGLANFLRYKAKTDYERKLRRERRQKKLPPSPDRYGGPME